MRLHAALCPTTGEWDLSPGLSEKSSDPIEITGFQKSAEGDHGRDIEKGKSIIKKNDDRRVQYH